MKAKILGRELPDNLHVGITSEGLHVVVCDLDHDAEVFDIGHPLPIARFWVSHLHGSPNPFGGWGV